MSKRIRQVIVVATVLLPVYLLSSGPVLAQHSRSGRPLVLTASMLLCGFTIRFSSRPDGYGTDT
jgi:hypothetical protein